MLGRERHARWAAGTAFALTVAMALGGAAFAVADHGTPLPEPGEAGR